MDLGVDEQRVAVEIISTLVHIKSTLVELVLKPAGIPDELYRPLLYRRDDVTGRTISKRQFAALILEAVATHPNGPAMLRALLEIGAGWSSWHLADKEMVARATVQKARELLGTLQLMEERETKQRELSRRDELARMERERAAILTKQSELLLMMFDDLAKSDDPQRRGYLLQDLLNRVFDLYEITIVRPFTRNDGAEQIDGAFKLEGWHYLVECRWRTKLADIRELDGLTGQVGRSGKQTMGLFLSINGWSENVPPLLKQNPSKSVFLMEGYDLRAVLSGQADLRDFLLAKLAKLNLETEPFLGVSEYLANAD